MDSKKRHDLRSHWDLDYLPRDQQDIEEAKKKMKESWNDTLEKDTDK